MSMRVNREQCICILCVLREIQDDFHFVIKCPAYSAIRSKYISHYSFIEDLASLSMFLFYSHHILVLGKYIYFAFALRKQLTNDT